ncbi:calycin-like domain-containing protein [Treponema maltophilum]|uniref:calycin-like domain-containing protein n=1 Tax=Treponema maltophilum TaxID=51160 RepID=UPI003D8BB325
MEKEVIKKSARRFLSGMGIAALTVFALLTVSCTELLNAFKDEALENHDISDIYGYTYYGNITSSGGSTLTPSLTIYNDERLDWNMSVNGMNINQFYYYSVKNSKNNYTLYWFSGADYGAAMTKDASKAAMTVQIGINSTDGVTILLTGDGLTGIGAMSNTRVPMAKQKNIPRNKEAPVVDFDPSIQDVEINIPSAATEADWGGDGSYTGKFDYLVGNGGNLARGHGTCGDGSEPNIILSPDGAGTHTVKITTHRFSYTAMMTILPFYIDGVKVKKDGDVYYLDRAAVSIPNVKKADGTEVTLNDVTVRGKLENGKLTLRISFKPGVMPFAIVEVFKSN